jgi:hypothetical protein
MRIGRSRVSAAFFTASTLASPAIYSLFANSTIKIPFLDTNPTSVTNPTCEYTLSVVVQRFVKRWTFGSGILSTVIVKAPNIASGTDPARITIGAIFAGDFEVRSGLNLHHDQGVVRAGDGCPPPGTTGGGGADDAGGTGARGSPGSGGTTGSGGSASTCGTCKDSGNLACMSGSCGQCSSDGQCCPPPGVRGSTCEPIVIIK